MNYKIKLNDLYVTEFVALPISIQKTVDESLDQANLRLVNTDMQEPIRPLSTIDIEFYNEGQTSIAKTYSFFVSNDNMTHNLASGTYNHELSLIELTKWLERFTNIVKCNTKPLLHDLSKLKNNIYYTKKLFSSGGNLQKSEQGITKNYSSPVIVGEQTILSAVKFCEQNNIDYWNQGTYAGYSLLVLENGVKIFETKDEEKGFKANFKSGKTYTIKYSRPRDGEYYEYYIIEMFIDCISIEKTQEKSIVKVIDLLLDNFETRTVSQTPRFALDPKFIEKYKNVIAPEINMQGTLFECLSQIGDYIHAIPRLRKRSSIETGITNPTKYIITFDELDNEDYVNQDLKDFLGHTESFSIDQYATSLDSNIDNLINTDNINEGSLTEPHSTGWKTPRTDLANVVIDDKTNCFIETSEAIEQIIKVEVGYIGNDYIGDITPFVYSKTEYDGQLSSISENYPLSKAFAIYYQPGTKNIYGLNFELPDAISSVFKDFAIINIIKQKTGKKYTVDIRDLQFRVTYIPNTNGRVRQHKTELQEGLPSSINFNQNSAKISSNLFGEAIKGALAKLGNPEVTKSYLFTDVSQVPKEGQKFDDDYYISVVKTENYHDFIKCDLGLSKNYNRKDKYMGLNSQIRFYEVSEIQAVNRQLYYEDYCIIGDDVDFTEKQIYINTNPELTTLQQGFNIIELEKFTENIEFLILQNNRPKRMIININDLPYTDDLTGIKFEGVVQTYPATFYIEYTGTEETKIGVYALYSNIEKPLITTEGLYAFANTFETNQNPITIDSVMCRTYTNDVKYGDFLLPLTSLGVGNSLFFHYEFIDNFTAGTSRSEVDGSQLQYQEAYADNFGEFDYMTFSLGEIGFFEGEEINNQTKAVAYGNTLPNKPDNIYTSGYFDTGGTQAINVNKDSSEVIAMNYQVNFVTNSDIIIGTEFAKNTSFLTKEPLNYKLYLLPKKIDKFARELDLTNAKEIGTVSYEINLDKKQIKIQDVEIGNTGGESWAICNGNKLMFGKNGSIAPNTTLVLPFITFKHII